MRLSGHIPLGAVTAMAAALHFVIVATVPLNLIVLPLP
jgi:hypothetical protein